MIRPAAHRAAVLLSSVVLATLLVPLVGIAAAADPVCPVDGESGSLDYDLSVQGEPTDRLAGNVEPGDRVVVEVDVPSGCPDDGEVELSLAAYEASEPTFPSEQQLVTSQSALLTPGPHVLEVFAPSSCFQVDLVFGRPLSQVSAGQRYGDRLIEAANGGSAPCDGPGIPPDPCPVDDLNDLTGAELADLLDPLYLSGDRSGDDLDDVVESGEPVTVEFTVPDGCAGLELTLASYTASGPTFPSDQRLHDHETGTFAAGPGTMTVDVPDCFYQVDFAQGPVIEDLDTQRYGSRLISAANGGQGPCAQPSVPPDTCPVDDLADLNDLSGAELADLLGPLYRSGDMTGGSLDDVVEPGRPVTVDFTVPDGCGDLELTLASYTASGPTFPSDQRLHDHETGTFAAGPGTMTVDVPDCFYQVDFAQGPVIEDLDEERYGRRLIDAANGGTEACGPAVVPGPSETARPAPSPTPTPSETTTPSPSPSPSPSETTTPSPSPSETTTPGLVPTPTSTPTPTVTPAPTPAAPIIVVSPEDTEAPAPASPPAVPAIPAAPAEVAPAPGETLLPAPGETPSIGVIPDDTPNVAAAPAPEAAALAVTGSPVPALVPLAVGSLLLGLTLLAIAWRRA